MKQTTRDKLISIPKSAARGAFIGAIASGGSPFVAGVGAVIQAILGIPSTKNLAIEEHERLSRISNVMTSASGLNDWHKDAIAGIALAEYQEHAEHNGNEPSPTAFAHALDYLATELCEHRHEYHENTAGITIKPHAQKYVKYRDTFEGLTAPKHLGAMSVGLIGGIHNSLGNIDNGLVDLIESHYTSTVVGGFGGMMIGAVLSMGLTAGANILGFADRRDLKICVNELCNHYHIDPVRRKEHLRTARSYYSDAKNSTNEWKSKTALGNALLDIHGDISRDGWCLEPG